MPLCTFFALQNGCDRSEGSSPEATDKDVPRGEGEHGVCANTAEFNRRRRQAPCLAIPMLNERGRTTGGIGTDETSERPNIVGRDGTNAVQDRNCARVRARNYFPGKTVP